MRNLKVNLLLLMVGLAIFAPTVSSQDAAEIMKKSHLAYFYAADDGVSDVHMSIVNKRGKERVREFIMLRLDETDGGTQKYYTYFKKPSDVSRMTFMVHKDPESNDARWIYIPSVDLIKPISADDKNSSFVGSDFSYEDVSGRHWSEDNHKLIKDSTIDGADVYVIESIPKEEYDGFAHKYSYVDKKTNLPLREEYYNKKDKLVKIFRAEKIEDISGILTITVRSMENVKKGGKTTVSFSEIAYNQGLKSEYFTERYLKNPPREFVK
ncbi:MAG: outer membrane lipoprotein-sorting protein [candidate division Zixibacteria bacterium]|nr:outer membrane lipoprotein-sorting protein [candidate division Zixibacteria bacterium]